jgi:hypothetical protein
MNWAQAVARMREGFTVNRQSEMCTRVIDPGRPDLQGEHWRDGLEHAPIVESGQEGARLMHAWTADDKPALVFMGADSKCLFVPDSEHRSANDWVIVAADQKGENDHA